MNSSLGPVLWPGNSLTPPRGWAVPTKARPLRIGVPNGSTFHGFLTADYKGSGNEYSFGGYAIDLFNLSVKNLQYDLPYKFDCFNGPYEQLDFDAAVGDIAIVSRRLEYAEFTHPYTQPGLVMVVPARRSGSNKGWLFMKPFTESMWIITGVITIYNGFVVWIIQRNHSSELRGSPLSQIGTLIWLSFSTLFSLHGEKLHSNLSKMAMVVWLFVALVITQTYTANLSSILTVKKLEATVTNIETLQRSNAMVGYCRGSYLARYLVEVLAFKEDIIKKFPSEKKYAEALRKREVEAIFLDVPFAKLFVAKYCKEFIVAGPTYKTGGFRFAFPRGSELIPEINKSLLNLSEGGKLRDLENKMLEKEKCDGDDGDDEEGSSISVTSYWVLFILTGGTSTVALVVYVVHCCRKLEDSMSQTTWKLMFSVIKYYRLSRKVSDVESSTNLPVKERNFTLSHDHISMDTLPDRVLFFLSLILLTFSQNVLANESTGAGAVGVIVDQSCRRGKEAKVAMDIAIQDVYHKMNHNFHLHIINSQSNPIHLAFAAKALMDTHKVQAIVGPQTWEEAQLVADIGNQARVPVLSLVDATPRWAADRWPFMVQAAPNNFLQMKAIAAIIDSWEWHRVTVIYEDTESSTAGIIPHLYDALRESGVEIAHLLPLPPLVSSSSMSEELEKIKQGQCRVILVHLSLPLATKLFERAKEMEMMQKDYVWIATDTFTNLVHSINASSISSMQGIIGVKSYFPKNESRFQDFFKQFRKRFISEFPEEDNREPGIYAVQAYDAVWTVCQAMIESDHYQEGGGKKLLDTIFASKFQGLSGKIELIGQKLARMDTFQIINVVGKSYRRLGYWSDAFGFSKRVVGNASNSSSMKRSLGPMLWPGNSQTPPRGWAFPTKAHPLRIGVPNGSTFQEFVTVDYKGSGNEYSFGGYAIDLFNLTVKNLHYDLPYKFECFNGTYEQLVQQVHSKYFDAAVGDIAIVSRRLEYAEFTHPYTQPGLVMVVPARRSGSNKAWQFMKPFTTSMWIITGVVTIYNGFVVWLIERNHSSELRGSPLNQIGTLIWLSFSTLFSLHGEKLHSNLSRMAMVVWLFVALVITQTYTANLSSILTVKKLEATVTNIETLQRSNAMVGYCWGSYLAEYLVEVLDFKENNIKKISSEKNYAEALRNREVEAIFLDVPFAKLFVAKYCKEFIVAGPTYKIGGFGFAFPRGSELIT
ncbi:hypothetical protein Dsin_022208 [Dipteronia sinensis]|uniref:Ionotropic glutamate receptor C-terminal domain-containing protein n=1 Tax=Dipteronia sinensis TaxID=43782 RepID=A0AAE0A101_9ROSI|nr:hypothetical protein Dsin_022208 [Dipteronia sinensis]